jgi:hypothetical protein
MKSKDQKIRRLLEEKDRHYDEAIDELLAGKADSAKKHLDYHQIASKIVDEYRARRIFYVALAVGAVCLLFIILLFSLTVWTTDAVMDIRCTEVMFKTSAPWQSETTFRGNLFNIDRLESVQTNFGPDLHTERLDLKGESIKLKGLSFDAGAIVWIKMTSGQLEFIGRNTSFRGKFSIHSGTVTTSDTSYQFSIALDNPPATFSFETLPAGSKAPGIELHLAGDTQWKVNGVKADSLRFEENYPPGTFDFRTTIVAGMVRLEETGNSYPIPQGQRLMVEAVRTHSFSLTDTGSDLHFKFRGDVSVLKGKYMDEVKDLKPTWLEYLYKNERMLFIWSAILFIIGSIWSIRNVLFK